MMEPADLKRLIEEGVPQSRADVRDLTGTKDHYEVVVVSPAFEGLPLVKRHQMVYGAVGTRMTREVHALSMQTLTPREWEQRAAGHCLEQGKGGSHG